MPDTAAKPLVVVATTPDDSHVWNLISVQLKLEERGFDVINLGVCTPATLVAEMLRDHKPFLLVISTVNGHGAISIGEVIRTLDEYQVRRTTTIVAGGLLTTDPDLSAAAETELIEMGLTKVFTGDQAWPNFDAFLVEQRSLARG